MQGTWVQSLGREDSNRHAATKPARTYWAWAGSSWRPSAQGLRSAARGARAPPQRAALPAASQRSPQAARETQGSQKWPQRNTTALTTFSQESTIKSKLKGALQTTDSDSSEILMTSSRQKWLGDSSKWMQVIEAWLQSTIKSYSDSWNLFTLYADSWGTPNNNFPPGNSIMSV